MLQQVAHTNSPMSVRANSSLRRGPTCQLAGMSSPQPPITVTLLDGVVRPVAPLGPVWGAVTDTAAIRALADLVTRSLEPSRLRAHLAHWIVERENARAKEAEAAKARKAARQEKGRSGTTKRLSASVIGRPRKISMPPASAPAAAVYAAFARAAGSDSARRAAYRFGRQSVWAAERAVEELVDREYRRFRAGVNAARVARFEAQLELRDGEELETLEKIYIVMSTRRAIANSPMGHDGASDEDPTSRVAEAAACVEEPDSDDPFEQHYWTPSEDESSTEVLKVVAAWSIDALETLAEHFDPLRVGMALVTPKALQRFMRSVRCIVQGRSKTGVLGKPEQPWFEELYAFSRCLGTIGAPQPAKQGARAKDDSGRYRRIGSGKAPKQIGHDFEAYRRKLSLGMHDLGDEPHRAPTPGGEHRLLDRLRDGERPVCRSAKALRDRRIEHARDRIRHVIDEFAIGTPVLGGRDH